MLSAAASMTSTEMGLHFLSLFQQTNQSTNQKPKQWHMQSTLLAVTPKHSKWSFLGGDVLTARAHLGLREGGGHVAGVLGVWLQTRDVHAVQQLLGGIGAVDDVAEGRAKAVLALVHAEGFPVTLLGQLGAVEGGPPVVGANFSGGNILRGQNTEISAICKEMSIIESIGRLAHGAE